jgi:glycosyltransferase involved in cell wall biosynthesis
MLNETMEQELVREDQASPFLMRTFSIIIPAYNEEKRISPVLEEISSFISANRLPWEVIIAVDGNDGTANLVKKMSVVYPFITVEHGHGRNGKGGAIKRGLNTAKGDYVIFMDADGSIKLSGILAHLDEITNYDAIVFDRYSFLGNRIPYMRRFASRGFNVLVKVLLGVRVNDTQCGYKIMKTEYAKKAFRKISVTNTFFDVALIFYLKKLGARIMEVPIGYNHDGESKFNVVSEILGQGSSLIAFRVRNSRFYKYVPKQLIVLYYRKFRWI